MAHFAKIDSSGIVLQVYTGTDNDNGKELELSEQHWWIENQKLSGNKGKEAQRLSLILYYTLRSHALSVLTKPNRI